MNENDHAKIFFDSKRAHDSSSTCNFILPSYMRNINSILMMIEKLSKVTWEIDGERVRI